MKDINDYMPKVDGLRWGALTNIYPTKSIVKQFDKMLPHDKKWHEVLNDLDCVWIDGHRIQRKTAESMT